MNVKVHQLMEDSTPCDRQSGWLNGIAKELPRLQLLAPRHASMHNVPGKEQWTAIKARRVEGGTASRFRVQDSEQD